ncbi:MAG TPA: hypothetical protein VGV65_05245 [Nocardioides sp.]|nr:hypothetical protein [Nocardioides sp.]
MRSSACRLAAALTCTLAVAACGSEPSGDATSRSDPAARTSAGTPGPATGIPDDFPLSAGMAGPEDTIATSRSGTGLRSLELCGTSPLRGLGTRDRMVADNSGGEALDTRELVLLGSPDEVDLVAQAFSTLPTDCDRPATSDGVETTTEVRESTFGAAPAVVLVQGYVIDGEPGPGHLVVHVVPVGAALLVTQTYGEWPDVSEGIARTIAPVEEVVEAMAVFADGAEPTAAAPESAPEASAEIPDDFPLLAGWPAASTAEADGGRRGPTRTGDPLEFSACDEPWSEPPHVDRLRSDWINAEDYRSRPLTTYADDGAAADAVAGLVSEQRSCPTEPPGEDGFATTREVRPVALGDDAWAILERDTSNGRPSTFGESTVVVRVGRAVLVVRHGGHAGYPDGDGQDQVEAMGSQAAQSIAQMCQFTKTGC